MLHLFSRVTLIRKLQSTSDLDHFHARELPFSRVTSRDDPISGRQRDSRVPYSFIYRDSSPDATSTPSSLAALKSRMVYLSGAGLPRLSWK